MGDTIVNARSKFHQSEDALRAITERAIGKNPQSFKSRELAGGFCNAVYLVETDETKLVLKIAPHGLTDIMSHEKGILKTEAEMLRIFAERINIPAPKLICYDDSLELCQSEYFFMSFMEGRPLNSFEPPIDEVYVKEMKRQIGEITRQISSIKAECFGIPALPETYSDNNCDFVKTLFDMLFCDAEKKNIDIPQVGHRELLDLIEKQRVVMNEASSPVYIHTDTWEGNLMVKDNRLVGLIDYAAVLYGDPLMNHDFHDFSPVPREEFLRGYGKTEFTRNERIRISVYKLWQRLGMIVERGYRGYEDKNLYAWVIDEFSKELINFLSLVN